MMLHTQHLALLCMYYVIDSWGFDIWSQYRLSYVDPAPLFTTQTNGFYPTVFIHAVVGVFQKKRGNETWGHGMNILVELIKTIEDSSIAPNISAVYITIIGAEHDRQKAAYNLSRMNSTSKTLHKRLQILIQGNNIDLAEFPTLHALQQYAMHQAPDMPLIYLHTKGVRKNGIANYPHEWRRYLAFMMVERSELCARALQSGYLTCGAQQQSKIYAGNFWWTTAGYIATKKPSIAEIRWSMQNRYDAEEYLLKDVGAQGKKQHYCVHHTHHNMQVCHTPREWYENISLPLRPDPRCFNPKKLPKNPTKDPMSWCHHSGLPV